MTVEEEKVEELVSFLKILADKNRIRILGLLSEREYSVRELALALEVKEPTVSSHLNLLKLRGLVTMRPDGNTHYYSLSQKSIHALLKELSRKASEEHEEDPNSSEFEKHVLRHFFTDGKLTEIPTKLAKQKVILRHLAQNFRVGEFYSELQVNEILKPFHPDCASLRRYMVDNRIMARENGRYWRLDERNAEDKP